MTTPRFWPLALALALSGALSACYDEPNPPAARDAGTGKDAGVTKDAGADSDAGTDSDAGVDTDGGTETDAGVDPCSVENVCDPNATCTTEGAVAVCTCNTGYTGDGATCADVDECQNANACGANSTCTNTPGSFTCACNTGYSDNGSGTCVDVDECTAGSDTCANEATCTNTSGSYTCACNNGFTGDGFTCANVDECAAPTPVCGANATCTDSVGSYSCACNTGYSDNGSGTCVDVDECTAGTDTCDNNATCANTQGSFTCACNNGYSGDGQTCANVDECLSPTACPANATCTDSPGSFSCACNTGYVDNGSGACVDVDECVAGTDTCDTNATCANTQGAFTCACSTGYSGDGQTCANVDECATGTATCGVNFVCNDTPGSYSCSCAPGFGPQGTACVRLPYVQLASSVSVTMGNSHSCAVSQDGSLWCWGANANSQLGDGTVTLRTAPVQTGSDSNWARVAAGESHSCGVKTDGTLWCWGAGTSGRLGLGTDLSRRASPVQVGTDTNWSRVVTGTSHTCAIKTDGTLWCWGDNSKGQLGNGVASGTANTPQQVGTDTDWLKVATGPLTTCGFRQDRVLRCWGDNSKGQLGQGAVSTTPVATPTAVGTANTWATVSMGRFHACGTQTDGTLWCWGDNASGQLGTGTSSSTPTAAPVAVGTLTTWTNVDAGNSLSCGSQTDGSLWCWGTNASGQVGDGTVSTRTSPTQVQPSTATWNLLAVGTNHVCAADPAGIVSCWGDNGSGQLGDRSAQRDTPQQVSGFTALAANAYAGGASHTAVVKSDGSLWTWGRNVNGQLGINSFAAQRNDPTQVLTPAATWSTVSAGGLHGCALQSGNTLWCWGVLPSPLNTKTVPTQIGTDTNWAKLGLGQSHSCAIKTDGTLWCFGTNTYGAVGDGTATTRGAPVQESTLATDWASVFGGQWHSCGLKTNGALYCWGLGSNGQVGDGTTTQKVMSPVAVATGSTWTTLALGFTHTCGIKSDNSLWCWGSNTNGQLGTSMSGGSELTPVQVATGSTWTSIAAGSAQTCGIKSDGSLWCWGAGDVGQSGLGSLADVGSPTQVGISTDWATAFAGGNHTCAAKLNGDVWCWGLGGNGQLGIGSAPAFRGSPGPIAQ